VNVTPGKGPAPGQAKTTIEEEIKENESIEEYNEDDFEQES